MTLYVLRAGPENGVDLGQGPDKILAAQERLGQDQAGRGVVRMADETVAAGRHRVVHAPGLAVEIREQCEAERCRILRQPLLVAADGGGERQLVGRGRGTGRRRLVRHRPPPTMDASAARTSAGETAETTPKAPVDGASTNGTRPPRAFLSCAV